MLNRCVAVGCQSGYIEKKSEIADASEGSSSQELNLKENVPSFHFPSEETHSELRKVWVKFVNRPSSNWKPSKSSVICTKHFEERFIIYGKRRKTLNMKSNPVPSIHSEKVCKRPSTIPTPVIHRKVPKKRDFSIDEMQDFKENDTIFSFEELNEKHSPPGFQFRKTDDCVLYYNLQFDEKTSFPKVLGCIRVDKELHVQLQFSGNPLPLPYWFVRGTNAKLSRFGMLINLAPYIRNFSEQNPYSLIEELENRRNYKPKGQPPFSSEMIRYALLLRYTSLQLYKLLLEKFPLPSTSLLNKLQHGGVDAFKAVKVLREKGEISDDVILMADEVYLQKCTQFHGGEYIGADVEGNLYKGVVALMIQGLKK